MGEEKNWTDALITSVLLVSLKDTIAINQCNLQVYLINFASDCFEFLRSAMITIAPPGTLPLCDTWNFLECFPMYMKNTFPSFIEIYFEFHPFQNKGETKNGAVSAI